MKEKTIWISYDLGLKGDYGALYSWLDANGANECGDSVAVLKYKYENDLISELTASFKKAINIEEGNRVYIVYFEDGKLKGKFIIGRRKPAPWKGYAIKYEEDIEDV